MKNKTVWWVEDDKDLSELLEEIVGEDLENLRVVRKWKDCTPEKGDVIIYDFGGVGEAPKDLDNYRVLSCSGNMDKDPDIQKPFDFDATIALIKSKL